MSSSRSDPGEATLAVGSQVRVRLVKAIHPDVEYDAVVVSDDGTHIVVRGPWAEAEARDLDFARFEPGDVFTEHYSRSVVLRQGGLRREMRPEGLVLRRRSAGPCRGQ